jgi:hypothetical protein
LEATQYELAVEEEGSIQYSVVLGRFIIPAKQLLAGVLIKLRLPEPSVTKTFPEEPSELGKVQILLLDNEEGALKPT